VFLLVRADEHIIRRKPGRKSCIEKSASSKLVVERKPRKNKKQQRERTRAKRSTQRSTY